MKTTLTSLYSKTSHALYRVRLLIKDGASKHELNLLSKDLWGELEEVQQMLRRFDTRLDQRRGRADAQDSINPMVTNRFVEFRKLIDGVTAQAKELSGALEGAKHRADGHGKQIEDVLAQLESIRQGLHDLATVQAEHHEAIANLTGKGN